MASPSSETTLMNRHKPFSSISLGLALLMALVTPASQDEVRALLVA